MGSFKEGVASFFKKYFFWTSKIPGLPSFLTTFLLIFQGVSSVLNFIFLLHIFAEEESTWFTYKINETDESVAVTLKDTPKIFNLNIASIVLSSLTLLSAMARTKSEESWKATKSVSVLSFASFAVVLTGYLLLLSLRPTTYFEIVYLISFKYMSASLALTGANLLSFIILVVFGGNPQLSDNFRSLLSVLISISFVLFYGALVFKKLEGWVYSDAVNFCIVTLTTIGYGNFTPKTVGGRWAMIGYAMIAISFLGAAIDLFRRLLTEDFAKTFTETLKSIDKGIGKGMNKVNLDMGDNKFTQAAKRGKKKIILIAKRFGVLFGLIGWWTGGAAVFMAFEGWSYFESFYFTFVTLTTIGYGDFFPVTAGGKTFLIFFSLTGLGLFAAGLSTITSSTSESMEENLNSLKGLIGKSKKAIPTDINQVKKLTQLIGRKKKQGPAESSVAAESTDEQVKPKDEEHIDMSEKVEEKYQEIFQIQEKEKFFEQAKEICKILSTLDPSMEPQALDKVIADFLNAKIAIEETFKLSDNHVDVIEDS